MPKERYDGFVFFPPKWQSHTGHLTDSAIRVYFDILLAMFEHEKDQCSITKDPAGIAVKTGHPIEKVEAALIEIQNEYKPLLRDDEQPGRYVSKGLQKTLEGAKGKSQKCSDAGKKGQEAKKKKAAEAAAAAEADASKNEADPLGNEANPSPKTSKEKKSKEEHSKEDLKDSTDLFDAKATEEQTRARVLHLWNTLAKEYGLRTINKMHDERWKKYQLRLKQCPDFWCAVERELMVLDDFAKHGKWFGFDWIVKSEANLSKLIEGNYRKEDTGPEGRKGRDHYER